MVPIRYNIRSLLERRATSLMTILGVALVSMIFVIVFGFTAGLRQSLLNAGEDRNVIVMARGVTSENESFVPHQAIEILRVRPEIATNEQHQALLSPESIAGVNISRTRGAKEFALLRGVDPIAYEVHSNLHLRGGALAGAWQRGMGGRATAVGAIPISSAPGRVSHYGHRDWKIVGVFSDNDSARESEAWTDIEDLINDCHWDAGGAAALHLVLKPGSAAEFAQAIKADGRLTCRSETETEYYAAQAVLAGSCGRWE